MISIILPTYNERENLSLIIPRISRVCNEHMLLPYEIIVVDDNSPDETADVAAKLSETYPILCIKRPSDRGLSKAVLAGMKNIHSASRVCVLMDADGSHPPESLPALIQPVLDRQVEMSVGSRYCQGGSVADWHFYRVIISKFAAFLSSFLIDLRDPTSGFMAVDSDLLRKRHMFINPIGWKIVLETAVKIKPKGIREVPITFQNRVAGESKLGSLAVSSYLYHIGSLYLYRFPDFYSFLKYLCVGFLGLIVDTCIFSFSVHVLSQSIYISLLAAFFTAVSANYLLNRYWSFSGSKYAHWSAFSRYVLGAIGGLGVRIAFIYQAILLFHDLSGWGLYAVNFSGILVASILNFLFNKYFVFEVIRPYVPEVQNNYNKA